MNLNVDHNGGLITQKSYFKWLIQHSNFTVPSLWHIMQGQKELKQNKIKHENLSYIQNHIINNNIIIIF